MKLNVSDGDHERPRNWKEDARLAWKLNGMLIAVLGAAIAFGGWGFNNWANNLDKWTTQTRELVQKNAETTQQSIQVTHGMIQDHLDFANEKVLEYERRLTTLEVDNHRHKNGKVEER